MRALALLTTTFALYRAAYCSPEPDAKAEPYLNTSPQQLGGPLQLFKRQGCPTNYNACNSLGDAGACCPSDTVCARDQNGNVACCPINASCTGVIGGTATGTSAATATSPFVLGGTTTTSVSSPITTSQATLGPGYSTVPNQYYPFIAIPTTYANAQQCLSAYTACQSASTACFNSLAGQAGVTVSGIGSQGVTQTAGVGSNPQSAASICSSLSAQGCFAISTQVCSNFGTVTSQAGGPVPVARCTGVFYTAAAAAFAGVAGLAL